MTVPIRRTKLIPPQRRADILTRDRLLDMLYELLDCRLILVAAPAGYGKTTLLVDLIRNIETPVCWFSVDALDQDPHRFLAHFVAAITEQFSAFGKRSMAALSNLDAAPDERSIGQFVTSVVNELLETVDSHFMLVVDDYQFVEQSLVIEAFLNQFVQSVDEHCHLILSSRTLVLLPDLSLMAARGQVGGISLEELAFSPDEIRALVKKNHNMTISTSVAEELYEATEGWITGLLLSAQTIWEGIANQLRVARASGADLYDFLARQVLSQQPAHVRDFLLRTSLLEEFDAEFCQRVLGPASYETGHDWHDMIELVSQGNVFVHSVGEQGQLLRYHHLFQEFLQDRVTREQPDEHRRILRRLGAVYEEAGRWEKAYDVYIRLDESVRIADLLEEAGPRLLRDRRYGRLQEWLDAVPHRELQSRPSLLSLGGIAFFMLGETDAGVRMLDQAEAAFRADDDVSGLARTLVRRAVAYRFQAHYEASLEDAREALQLVDSTETLADIKAEALRVQGLANYRLDAVDEAIDALTASLDLYQQRGEMRNAAMVRMELGLAYRAAGDFLTAQKFYEQSLHDWREMGNVAWQANVLNNLGVLHHYRGEYCDAVRLLEEGLVCARESGDLREEAYILCSLGDIFMEVDAGSAAFDVYQAAREVLPASDRFLRLHLLLAEAALLRRQGEFGAAHERLAAAEPVVADGESAIQNGQWQHELGRLAYAEGRLREAEQHLQTALSSYDHGAATPERIGVLVSQVRLQRALEKEKQAQAVLEQVADTVDVVKSPHLAVVVVREAMEDVLALAEENGRLSQLYEDVVAFEEQIPQVRRQLREQVTVVSFAPPQLDIHTLGLVRVQQPGTDTVLTSTDWPMQSARDLFFCLLAHPRGLTRDMASEFCWPDLGHDKQKWRFKNSLHYVRDTLGKDVVVYEQGRYWFNRRLDYRYDVETFHNTLERAGRVQDIHRKIDAYDGAIAVYDGEFLPDMDGAWVAAEREQLHQTFVDALVALAHLYIDAVQYDETLAVCRRALEEDTCLEEAHQLAMRAHAGKGDHSALVRQYKQCRDALRRELGVDPSSDTEELYRSLLG